MKFTKLKIRDDALDDYLMNATPDTDICRVVKAFCTFYKTESVPSVFSEMDWRNAKPSALSIMKCDEIMKRYVKDRIKDTHPVHILDRLLMDSDVTIDNRSITYEVEKDGKKEPVTMASKMGVFATSNKDVMFSVAATLISYTTNREKSGITNVFDDKRKCDAFLLPRVDGVNQRAAIKISTTSPTLFRDEVFTYFNSDTARAGFLIDGIMQISEYHALDGNVKVFLDREKNKHNEKQKKLKIPEKDKKIITRDFLGAVPACIHLTYTPNKNIVLSSVLKLKCNVEQTISLGFKGRGALTSGYALGDMSGSHTKNLVLAKELIMIVKNLKVDTVQLPSIKGYGLGLIRILIANNVSVVSDRGTGLQQVKQKKKKDVEDVYGHYAFTHRQVLTVLPDVFTAYSFNSNGITFANDSYDAEKKLFLARANQNLCVMCTSLTDKLLADLSRPSKDMCYVPKIMPDDCRIWLLKGRAFTFDINTEMRRFLVALYCRLSYPFVRRPFSAMDDVIIKYYSEPVTIPKVERALKVDRFNIQGVKARGVFEIPDYADFYNTVIVDQEEREEIDPSGVYHMRLQTILATKNNKSAQLRQFCVLMDECSGEIDFSDYSEDPIYIRLLQNYNELQARQNYVSEAEGVGGEDESEEGQDDVVAVDNNDDGDDGDPYGEALMGATRIEK